MSSEPEAVVRRVIELFNSLPVDPKERARSDELRDLLELFDEEVEFTQLRMLPDRRDVRGRIAFRDAWAEWLNTWESQRSEVEEVHRRGNRLLVFSRDRFMARDGLGIDWRGSTVYEVEADKIVRIQVFGEDRDAAWSAFNEGSPPGD